MISVVLCVDTKGLVPSYHNTYHLTQQKISYPGAHIDNEPAIQNMVKIAITKKIGPVTLNLCMHQDNTTVIVCRIVP